MCHGRANMNQISLLAFFLIKYNIFSLILKLQRLNLLSNFPEKPLKIPEKEKEKKTVRGMWPESKLKESDRQIEGLD